MLHAYETLLKHQSSLYREHLEWGDQGKQLGEAVRAAMIVTRRSRNPEYDVFLERLREFQR